MSEFEKLDSHLLMLLRAYEESPERDPDDGISLGLRFTGDLAPIEALGFQTHSVSGQEARGVVRFKDLRAIAAHPGVLWISAGRPRRPHLEVAPKDIRARATTAGGIGSGGDGLWHAVDATGVLTQAGNTTGAGVIVAVIDTGIDFTHPMFMSQLTPTKVTRILRIWDQGLSPTALADCPPLALLQSPNRYGVEFDYTEINTALNGGAAVAHKDCEGHGTHVAGIAAGGVKFPAGTAGADATRVGVAPEADIIAVKLLDTPDVIRYRLATGFGSQVGWDDQFRDAVLYCLRTARNLGKPVVINMSFGDSHEPGDGLDSEARWLDSVLDPAKPAGPLNFPTRAVVVKASGNDGDLKDRFVARIKFPAGAASSITVPLVVKDDPSRTSSMRRTNCASVLHNPPLYVSFWYRRDFDNVKFAVKLPFRNTFSADMGVGGNFDFGLILRPGPPPSLAFVPITTRVHRVSFLHGGDQAVPHPSGGTVRRHEVTLTVTPKTVGSDVTYLEGIYEVRITAPGDSEIFLMGDFAEWGLTAAAFTIADTMADGSPLPPDVAASVTNEFSAADTGGANVLTVAAYDDKNTVAGADHPIADFSSRGPLRDFSDPPGSKPLIATKPDLSAPGVNINSAWGVNTDAGIPIRTPAWKAGVRFIEHDGTSMAAPVVTGVVALMLDKKATLSTTDVRTILRTAAAGRPGNSPGGPGTAHDRAYGAGMVAARESHDATH